MALKLQLVRPGEWTLSRNSVAAGKLRRTRQSVILAFADPQCCLSAEEKSELETLVRNLITTPYYPLADYKQGTAA